MTAAERFWIGVALVASAHLVRIAAWAVAFVAGWSALGLFGMISGTLTTSSLPRTGLFVVGLAGLAAALFYASYRLARAGSERVPEQQWKRTDRLIWVGLFVILTTAILVVVISSGS